MSQLIKVMHLRASPFLGSPEKLMLGRMAKMDNEVCRYSVGIFNEQRNGGNDFYTSVKELNVESFLLRDSMVHFISNVTKIRRKVQEFAPHVICAHDYKSNLYGLFLSKICGIPVMSTFHGKTKTDMKVELYYMIDSLVLKYFDAVVCVSQKTAEIFNRNVMNRRIYVIPNSVDIEEIRSLAEKNVGLDVRADMDNKIKIMFAGRLSKEKGIPYLIQAAELVQAKYKNITYMIFGEGPEEHSLKKMISEKGLGESIHIVGFKKNIYPYLKSADAFVLPSLTEGMPVTILESFALCKPVIASNVGGIPEVILDGYNGLLVNPGNVKGLANAVESVIENPEKAEQMGKNGYNLVRARHTFEIQAKQYLSVYNELLRNH